jgi:L-ribulokinase
VGGYDSIEEAAARMARLSEERYRPDPERARIYDELFAEYRTLHDHFGRGGNDVMRRLRARRARPVGEGVAASA